MLKSLLYKDFLLLRKYYAGLLIGFLLMNFSLHKNIMIITAPFLLFFFQGMCIKTTSEFDKVSNFREFILTSTGEKKYIDSIYVVAISNVAFSILFLFLIVYRTSLPVSFIGFFFSVHIFIYSFTWAIQIPLSYKKEVSTFRVIELILLIFFIILLFGLGGQYYGQWLSVLFKYEPIRWGDHLNLEFHFIYIIFLVFFSISGFLISRFILLKLTVRQRRKNK